MPQQIRQGIVHIVEVSDQSCEGKEHHGHGDKNGTQGAEGGGQGRLKRPRFTRANSTARGRLWRAASI
ncbi:Uncharacterised protein [uncultured Blautia sp.]|nr:Uncharacterised protein [uncultured Blautia sp.]